MHHFRLGGKEDGTITYWGETEITEKLGRLKGFTFLLHIKEGPKILALQLCRLLFPPFPRIHCFGDRNFLVPKHSRDGELTAGRYPSDLCVIN